MRTSPNMTVCCCSPSLLIQMCGCVPSHRPLQLLSPPIQLVYMILYYFNTCLLFNEHQSFTCLVPGKWAVEQLKENKVPGDQGLVLKSRAKHHAIAAMLNKPFVFEDEPLVIQ